MSFCTGFYKDIGHITRLSWFRKYLFLFCCDRMLLKIGLFVKYIECLNNDPILKVLRYVLIRDLKHSLITNDNYIYDF